MLLFLVTIVPISVNARQFEPWEYDHSETCSIEGETDYNGMPLSGADVYFAITGENTAKVIGVYSGSGYYMSNYGVEIPSEISFYDDSSWTYKEYTVTEIGDGAFKDESYLRMIRLPSTITKIGDEAFMGCQEIQKFVNSPNLESIGDRAFQFSTVRNITFYRNFTLGTDAFKSTYLYTLICPEAMKDVIIASAKASDNSPYNPINSTHFFTFGPNSKFEDDVLYGMTGNVKTSIIYGGNYKGDYTVPSTVTEICDQAFEQAMNVTSVTIPSNVKKIGSYAFAFSMGLRQINMPSTEVELAVSAFSRATFITSIDLSHAKLPLPDSVCMESMVLQEVKLPAATKIIPTSAFEQCHQLNSINIPEGLTTIKDRAFVYCQYANLELPSSLTSVGKDAFANCGIKKMVVPDGVVFSGSFYECNFETLEFKSNKAIEDNLAVFDGAIVQTLVIPSNAVLLPTVNVQGMSTFNVPSGVTTIPNGFFYDSNLSSITLPSKLTTIEDYAFCNSKLTTITIPSTVNSIGKNAFANCKNLTSASISSAVSTIEESTFSGCTKLSQVIIPSVTQIKGNAFKSCTSLASISLPNTLTQIGANAFEGCTALTSVTVPIKVTAIDTYAFRGCTSLTTVTIPASVKTLGTYCFSGCTKLANITMAEGATTIGAYAFQSCSALVNISLPSTLTSLGGSVFAGTGINEIIIPPKVPAPSSTTANYDPLFSKTTIRALLPNTWSSKTSTYSNAVLYTGSTKPEKTDDGFYYENSKARLLMAPLTLSGAYTIPSTVTQIADRAFKNCTELTGVTVPASIQSIGTYCFSGCTKLANVQFNEGLTSVNSYAFDGCTALKSVSFPATLKTVGTYAFKGCTGITSLDFKEGLTTINNYAFNSTKVTDIIVPSTVTTIGTSAFPTTIARVVYRSGLSYSWPTAAVKITYPAGMTVAKQADGCVAGTSGTSKTLVALPVTATLTDGKYIVPAEYSAIGSGVYKFNTNVTKLVIPGTVKTVSDAAFDGCTRLISVEFGDGVQTLGATSFQGTNITSVFLPNSVTSVGKNAFNNCSKLLTAVYPEGLDVTFPAATLKGAVPEGYEMEFASDGSMLAVKGTDKILLSVPASAIGADGTYCWPNGITKIGKNAFSACSTLTEIVIPDDVMTIGEGAFKGLTQLNTIVFEDGDKGLNTIEANAFAGCTGVTTLILPTSVETIAEGAFSGCDNLTKVVCPAKFEERAKAAFANATIIDYPDDCKRAYFTPDGMLVAETPEDNPTVYLLAVPTDITLNEKGEFVIPEYVNVIYDGAIAGVESIKSVIVPKDVEIGSGAFRGCEHLTTVAIAEGVTTIGAEAFVGCSNLTTLILPSTIDNLGEKAFDGCDNLSKLVYPDSENLQAAVAGINVPETCRVIAYPANALAEIQPDGRVIAYDKSGQYVYLVAVPNDMPLEDGKYYVVNDDVNYIYEGALAGCSNITSVYIREGVTVGKNAFKGCEHLQTVELDEGVTTVMDGAFANCDGLTTIVLPSTLTNVGNDIFAECDNLQKVVYPSSLQEEVNNAGLLEGTVAIEYDPTKMSISIDELGYVIGTPKGEEGRILVAVPNKVELDENGNFNIPDGITEINGGALAGCDITSVIIPESVKTIGAHAFEGCANLQTVAIGNNVETIGESAFANCDALNTLILPKSVTSLDETAFDGCDNITKLVYPATDELHAAVAALNLPENCKQIDYPATATPVIDPETGVVTATDGNKVYLVAVPEDLALEDGKFVVPANVTDIYEGAFENCRNITEIELPATVKTIGAGAFAGCEKLEVVEINEGVTTIGEKAFEGCNNIAVVVLPSTIDEESIPANVFEGAEALTKVVIPDNLEQKITVGQNVATVTYPEGATVSVDEATGCVIAEVKGEGDVTTEKILVTTTPATAAVEGTFTVPEGVTTIGKGALTDLTDVKEVVIPGTVTAIGDGAFEGMTNLTSVELGEGIKTIGDNAFAGTGITEVTLPEGLTEIGSGAFSGTAITEVTVPSTVETIGAGAFQDCKDLAEVKIEKPAEGAEGGLTSIGDNAFSGSAITSVEIPSTVTEIGDGAFKDCKDLTEVKIEKPAEGTEGGLTSIGNDAFNGAAITSVDIPSTVTTIGNGAFAGTQLTEVVIPSTVENLGEGVLAGCDDLVKVVAPEGAELGISAPAEGEKPVAVVTYPAGTSIEVTENGLVIGTDADGNKSLVSVSATTEHEVVIPEDVTSVGAGAFAGCGQITTVVIPDNVTSVGDGVFEGCENLTSVVLPSDITDVPSDIFDGLDNLTKVVVPDNGSVTIPDEIAENITVVEVPGGTTITVNEETGAVTTTANDGKTELTLVPTDVENFEIPADVTSIGQGAFSGCDQLTEIKIPETVTEIGDDAFKGCTSLENVVIPDQVTEIGNGTFEGCTGLTNVVIPSNVESIGDNTFAGCENLTYVYLPASVTTIGDGVFNGCTSLETVNIPETVTAIGDNTFSGCSSLTEVTLPENVETIGDGAFNGCTSLTTVEIPANVTEIGAEAFKDCENLSSVILPPTVTTVGEGAFSGCTNMTKPAYPSTIENNPFESGYAVVYNPETDVITPDGWIKGSDSNSIIYAPESLEGKFTVDNSVSEIGANAFAGCEQLKGVTIAGSETEETDTPVHIGANAFAASGVETLDINRNWTIEGEKTPFPELTEVSIGEKVTEIPANSFNGSQLTEANIPANVEVIGAGAFNCETLTAVNLSDGISTVEVADGAFGNAFTEVYMGRPVAGTPFAGSSVENVVIGNAVSDIEKSAFENCANLTELHISSTVTVISEKAFCNTGLVNVVLPPSVQEIGASAFANSSDLDEIVIGPKVTKIGEKAFAGTSGTKVHITALVPPAVSANSFNTTDRLLVQGDASVTAYKAADVWKGFNNVSKLQEANTINVTGAKAFTGKAGDTFQLTAELSYVPGENETAPADEVTLKHVFWRSTNPEVATVDHTGLVTLRQDLDAPAQTKAMRAPAAPVKIVAESLYANGPSAELDAQTGDMSGVSDVIFNGTLINSKDIEEIYDVKGMRIDSTYEDLVPGVYMIRHNNEVKKVVKH